MGWIPAQQRLLQRTRIVPPGAEGAISGADSLSATSGLSKRTALIGIRAVCTSRVRRSAICVRRWLRTIRAGFQRKRHAAFRIHIDCALEVELIHVDRAFHTAEKDEVQLAVRDPVAT